MSSCGLTKQKAEAGKQVRPDLDDAAFVGMVEEKVKQTIADYDMFSESDKIICAVSGGKDSTVMLSLLKKFGYDVEAVTVDAKIGCYTDENLKNIRTFCQELNVKLHEISFREEFGYSLCYMKALLDELGHNLKSCTICGVLRRFLLNKKVRELKGTKVVMGHNKDDEAQVIFMNMLKHTLNLSARMGPITGLVKDKRFVTRVKPLYFISEQEVVRYALIKRFPVQYGECPCSEDAFRRSIKRAFAKLVEHAPDLKDNLLQFHLSMLPKLRETYATKDPIGICEVCGEPTTTTECRACQLVGCLKGAREQQENIISVNS